VGLIDWFIDRPAVANLLAFLLLAGGIFALNQTRQETLPNVPLERIGVVSELPSASPSEVEQRLCYPLETAIATVEGVTDIRSESREGVCSITVDVVEGENAGEVRDRMAARVQALSNLPPDATAAKVEEVVFRNRVARLLVVGGDQPMRLHSIARQLRSELLALPEISEVRLEGLPEREISLTVSRQNLHRYDLTLQEIADAIDKDTGRVPGGMMRGPEQNSLLLAGRTPESAEAYGDVVVRRGRDGEALHFRDLGQVEDGFHRDAMGLWLDGQRAVALDVYRIGQQDVVATVEAVYQFLDQARLPDGVTLQIWQDDAKQYLDRSSLLWTNALQGLVLLVLLLGVFFGLRLSFWVAAGIPVAMIGACMILPLTGGSLNTISLFAFILVLGIVVDDAVIVGESVADQIRLQGPGRQAVRDGTVRVALPIVVAVVTTALSFTPMLFLPGPEGEFMRIVPIIAITVLALSLMESLLILPSHLKHASSGNRRGSWLEPLERMSDRVNQRFEALVRRHVEPMVQGLLHWRLAVLTGFFGLFLLCFALMHSGWLSVTMFSNVAGDRVIADLRFTEGTSGQRVLEATRALQLSASDLQRQLTNERGEPLITSVLAEQGRRDNYSTAHDPSAQLRARVSLALAPGESPLPPDEIANAWRRSFMAPEGVVSMRFHTSINQIKPDIHVNLYHPDPDTLMAMSAELESLLASLEGVYEIGNNMRAGFTELDLRLRPGGELAGLDEGSLGEQVRMAFQGVEIDRLPMGDHDVPVVLRLPDEQTNSLWHLEQLPVSMAPGNEPDARAGKDNTRAPLSVLADIQAHRTPAVIPHYDRKTSATVTAYVETAISSPGKVMAHLQQSWLNELPERWPGASWETAGKPVAIGMFLDYLTASYLVAMVAMFFVLTMMFGNYWQPLLIVAAIPFGLVGAVLGHAALGLDLTLWSVVGMVAVSGVVINDNLVLIDRINDHRKTTKTLVDAIRLGIRDRVRPIVLTTLTTFLAVMPLAFETNPQAGFLVPMAVSLGFGVMFASLTTLLLVPCLMVLGSDAGEWLGRQVARLRRSSEADSVDQAYQAGVLAGELASRAGSTPVNPYRDDVLAASWEAGVGDANPV